MITIYVICPGDEGTRFDRDWYVRRHLPLVMACWGPLGTGSCAAFWPADIGAGTIAIAECRFGDDMAMRAALASLETPGMITDIACFTDAKPAQNLAGPI